MVEAFAFSLHKLMAYKDEYEVARLLLAPQARAAAEAVGGKGARVQWQLHPPMLRSLGMKRKIKLGRWATPLLVALRAGRILRGTPFDVPGWSHLRRVERKLAGEYVEIIMRLLRGGAPLDITLEVAGLPDIIRGYEGIKVANIAAYRGRLTELLARANH